MTTLIAATALLAANAVAKPDTWRIQGELSEACSCSVPCPCNFGESPSPHAFCDAVYSVDIKKGDWNGVSLNGLRLAGAIGEKGAVFYIDDRASAAQEKALMSIAKQIIEKMYIANKVDPKNVPDGYALLGIAKASVDQKYDKTTAHVQIAGHGGYDADYIMGIDGKTPVVVQNNWSWNMKWGYKAKTKKMTYKDEFGNAFEFEGTNSNEGPVDWSDKTPVYIR